MRLLRSAACAIAALAVLSQVSQVAAAPIKSMDGTTDFGKLASSGGTFTMTWAPPIPADPGTRTTLFNGAPTGVGSIPTFLLGYQFSATPTSTGTGTKYNFIDFVTGGEFLLQPFAGQGGGTADFDLKSMTAFVPDAAKNTIIFSGDVSLLANTTAFDLSPFNLPAGGKFTITFNTGAGTDLNAIIAGGSAVNGSASFSLVANPAVVPEPGSIALFGVLTVAGGLIARRKVRNSSVVEA